MMQATPGLSEKHRICCRSCREATSVLLHLVLDVMDERDILYLDRLRPKAAPVLSALLLAVSKLPKETRVAMVRDGMKMLNDTLMHPHSESPAKPQRRKDVDFEPPPGHVNVGDTIRREKAPERPTAKDQKPKRHRRAE